VPDAISDAAHEVADTARAAKSRASRTAHSVAASTGQARTQATERVVELGHAAREDDPRHWRALIACILAVVGTAIDPPILQATSSGIQGALRLEPDTVAAIVGGFYLLQAGVMVAAGVLGDRFGGRRVLIVGLLGLLVGTLIAATASTAPILVGGYVVVSLASALVIPLSLASVMTTFGQRVLPVAFALYLSIQLLASLAAPATANLLFDAGGLAATFLPSLVASVLALMAVGRWLPETRPEDRMPRLDALSLGIWSLGMLAIVYAMMAFAGGWGGEHVLAAILGIGCVGWVVARLVRGHTSLRAPDLPYRILGLTLLSGAVLGLSQSGSLMQLSTFLKGVQGYGDIASGVAIGPFALATLVTSVAVGIVMTRRSRGSVTELRVFRRPIAGGLTLVAISMLLLGTLEVDTGYVVIGGALAILGLGASVANVPRTDLLFRSVRRDRVGVAAGLNGSAFLLGEALGNVSVTAMIAISSAAAWQAQLVAAGMTPDQAVDAVDAAQRAGFLVAAHPFLEPAWLDVASQVPGWDLVFTDGFTAAMIVLATIAALTAVLTALGLRDSVRGG
jgi:DHA2 family multidrug resistance protein-like MFS transporter